MIIAFPTTYPDGYFTVDCDGRKGTGPQSMSNLPSLLTLPPSTSPGHLLCLTTAALFSMGIKCEVMLFPSGNAAQRFI